MRLKPRRTVLVREGQNVISLKVMRCRKPSRYPEARKVVLIAPLLSAPGGDLLHDVISVDAIFVG